MNHTNRRWVSECLNEKRTIIAFYICWDPHFCEELLPRVHNTAAIAVCREAGPSSWPGRELSLPSDWLRRPESRLTSPFPAPYFPELAVAPVAPVGTEAPRPEGCPNRALSAQLSYQNGDTVRTPALPRLPPPSSRGGPPHQHLRDKTVPKKTRRQ